MIDVVEAAQPDRARVAHWIGQLYSAHDHMLEETALLGRADDMIAANRICFLRRNGAEIGYAALHDMGDHMFIRHFVIDATLRRTGIGTAAFEALEARCFAGRQVRLDASHTLDAPRSFWEAQGFRIMGYTMRRNVDPLDGVAA